MESEQKSDDVTVRLVSADDKSILLHRRQLENNSGYFRGLVNSGMMDSNKMELKFETLFFENLLEVERYFQWLHGGGGPFVATSKSAKNLERMEAGLNAAMYLQIDQMISLYVERLSTLIDSATWHSVCDITEKYFLKSVKQVILNFLLANMDKVISSSKLHLLPASYMEEVLRSDALVVRGELMLFEGLSKWLCHHQDCSWMYKLIRYELMDSASLKMCEGKMRRSSQVFSDVVRESLVEANHHLKSILANTDSINSIYSTLNPSHSPKNHLIPNFPLFNCINYHPPPPHHTPPPPPHHTPPPPPHHTPPPTTIRLRNSSDVFMALGGFTGREVSTNSLQVGSMKEIEDVLRIFDDVNDDGDDDDDDDDDDNVAKMPKEANGSRWDEVEVNGTTNADHRNNRELPENGWGDSAISTSYSIHTTASPPQTSSLTSIPTATQPTPSSSSASSSSIPSCTIRPSIHLVKGLLEDFHDFLSSRLSSSSSIHPSPRHFFDSLITCPSHHLPTKLCEHQAAVLNGVLYVVGGQTKYHVDGSGTTPAVHKFSPLTGAWETCAKMHHPRSLFYLGILGNRMYAVGGSTCKNLDTPTVEWYDPFKDCWSLCGSLPTNIHEHAGCINENTIFISGGFRGVDLGHTDLVWKYDIGRDCWEEMPSLLTRRSLHCMVAVEGRMFVLGGVRYLSDREPLDIMDGEMYDGMSRQWSKVIKLLYPASCMSHLLLHNNNNNNNNNSNNSNSNNNKGNRNNKHKHNLLLFGGHSFVQEFNHDDIQVIDLSRKVGSDDNDSGSSLNGDAGDGVMNIHDGKLGHCSVRKRKRDAEEVPHWWSDYPVHSLAFADMDFFHFTSCVARLPYTVLKDLLT